MFQIKICGVTRASDVAFIRDAGADAIGLNFYPQSKRFVSLEAAKPIAVAAGGFIKVGVFVNSPAEEVCETFDALSLDLIQLHGDEPPEFLTHLGGRPVLRVFRVGGDGLSPIAKYLDACRVLDVTPVGVLLDAHVPGEYGGSGAVADWARIVAERVLLHELPLILAGGLTGENVGQAITSVRPDGVDTASGVETAPGDKDQAKVKKFCEAASGAIRSVGDK